MKRAQGVAGRHRNDYRPTLMARSLRASSAAFLAAICDTAATKTYGGDVARGCLGGRGHAPTPNLIPA